MKLKKMTFKIIFKTIGVALLLSVVAMLPFFHDVIIDKQTGVKDWVPNFNIEKYLTNESGKVRSYSSYRIFIYFMLIHVFASIGWMGWALDAKHKSYRFFLLVPACLSFFSTLVILFDARETSFNNASTKIFLIIVVNFLLMMFYFSRYYRNKSKK